MKKRIALTLLALLLCTAALASAGTYSAGAYYTLDYDDGYTLDDTTYTGDTNAEYIWLFMLFDAQITIDAALEPATGYEGVNLYEMNEAEREAYVADTMEVFADSNAAYVDDVTSVSGYPFYIFSMDDGDGAYYYAETLIEGTSVNLLAYYRDDTATLDAALLTALEEVLITIRPADDVSVEKAET
jgi:hypothetical protein